jgi:hypothetical protein
MSAPLEMSSQYHDLLYSKYTVIGHFNFLQFHSDFSILEQCLEQCQKDCFAPTDRIIIEHMDTDYYLGQFPYGLGLLNLIRAFKEVDIPLFTLLLFTNHFGIEQELDSLLSTHCDGDRPTVITSLISTAHYSTNYVDVCIDADAIEIPAISMMNHSRVHRDVLATFINQNGLQNTIAAVYHKL